MGKIRMNYYSLITLLALAFFALLAVTGGSSNGSVERPSTAGSGGLKMLPRRGRQERVACTAEGPCMNKVVTCPAKCPEMKWCSIDCAAACAAACKGLPHKSTAYNESAYQTWCNKTGHERLCASMVQSDPRKKLKSSPQGLVVILVSAAQAKANDTRLFINETLQNQTMDDSDDSKAVLKGCLLAYNLDWVNSAFGTDIQQVRNRQRCSDLNDSLRTAVSEVTYDCEWDLPSPRSPTLNQMYENVESLASIVDSARQILSLIGCGAL